MSVAGKRTALGERCTTGVVDAGALRVSFDWNRPFPLRVIAVRVGYCSDVACMRRPIVAATFVLAAYTSRSMKWSPFLGRTLPFTLTAKDDAGLDLFDESTVSRLVSRFVYGAVEGVV